MKSLIYVLTAGLVLLALGGPSAQAGVIMLLTQNTWEGGSGQVGLPDDGFIAWLQGQGHTVIKNVVTGVVNAATLETEAQSQGVQLIIIGPRNSSGNYTDQAINQIGIPMISLLPHGIRNNTNRLDWLPAQQGSSDNNPWTTETIVRPTHPWVAGLSSTWFTYPTGSGDTRWTLAVETDTTNHLVGNGQVISLLNTTPGPTVGLVYWDKGVKAYDASTDGIFGEKRVWLGGTDWARFTPANYQCSFDNYTADGKEVLRRTINGIIPEPATLALLGLGLGGMLLRRRSR